MAPLRDTVVGGLERLGSLDRRIIFLVMAAVIVAPTVLRIELPVRVSQPVRDIYEAVEALPPGSRVLLASDFEPGAMPELRPFQIAVARHLFRKEGIGVVGASLWVAGPPLVDSAFELTAPEHGRVYGEDYVNLGFQEGRHMVIISMGRDLRSTFPRDARGTPIDEIPVMAGLRTLRDFDLIINISSGSPGTREWVQLAQSRYDLPMVALTTAVMAPEMVPYHETGQLIGLGGGMAASAEYEALIGEPGRGTMGLPALAFAHVLIVIAILLANVSHFAGRRRRRRA